MVIAGLEAAGEERQAGCRHCWMNDALVPKEAACSMRDTVAVYAETVKKEKQVGCRRSECA